MKRTETRGPLRLAAVVVISSAVALGAVAPANADMPFDSKIRLKDSFPAFHGLVKSDGGSCIANREVRLFKERRNGADKVLGKTRTALDGKWEILKEPGSGVYYAKVNQYADEASGVVCYADVSKKVVID